MLYGASRQFGISTVTGGTTMHIRKHRMLGRRRRIRGRWRSRSGRSLIAGAGAKRSRLDGNITSDSIEGSIASTVEYESFVDCYFEEIREGQPEWESEIVQVHSALRS